LVQDAENCRLIALLKEAERKCEQKCEELKEQWRVEKESLERRLRETEERCGLIVSCSVTMDFLRSTV